jgi:UrcA family protein
MRNSIALIDRVRPRLSMVIALGALTFGGMGAQATDLQEVTVTVPTVQTIGRDASGAAIQQVSASARVQYDPIMLTTYSGRALLRDKVAEVARRLCRSLDITAGPLNEDEGTCVQRAVDGAKVQIAAAAAGQKAG